MGAGKSAPTVMIYGHYDVQPVDPLELWTTDPFKPEVRGDHLFARGASDMKGQVMASLKAVEAIVRTTGLPVNVKWLIEGEARLVRPPGDQQEQNSEAFCLNPMRMLAR
jgi:acetylornithine deacetylase/succinyl-diaminopimelate desuccinylase-like protein